MIEVPYRHIIKLYERDHFINQQEVRKNRKIAKELRVNPKILDKKILHLNTEEKKEEDEDACYKMNYDWSKLEDYLGTVSL